MNHMMPKKISTNRGFLKTFSQIMAGPQRQALILDFSQTIFIQPLAAGLLGIGGQLLRDNGGTLQVRGLKESAVGIFSDFGLLPGLGPRPVPGVIAYRRFQPADSQMFTNYLESQLLRLSCANRVGYINFYLTRIFEILGEGASIWGHWNPREDWIFLGLFSSSGVVLDDWVFHLLEEELRQGGGTMEVYQDRRYCGLKDRAALAAPFPGTLFLLGFYLD